MTKQQKFKREYATELLSVAKDDLLAATALQQANIARTENIFLFAQQALEKSLKAVLCAADQPIPLIHDIGVLVAKIEALGLVVPFEYSLNSLTEYATIRRYLEGKESFTADEVAEILSQVADAVTWCQEQARIK